MTEEFDNRKDVFAHFGLAAYHAQCFEMEIKNMFLLIVRVNHKELPHSFFDGAETTLDKQMLGTLVRDLKKVVAFDDSAEALLDDALTNRNRLTHGFFEWHAVELLSHTGRVTVIEKLEKFEKSFRLADAVCQSVSRALCQVLGITEAYLSAELEKIRKIAKNEDTQSATTPRSEPAVRSPQG